MLPPICKECTQPKHWARDYYRRNKEERTIVHSCKDCEYETTGPKQTLLVHIWSKHTEENERPFQCEEQRCCRGFAQKSNLQKHLLKVHGKKVNLSESRDICLYIIKPGKFTPASNKTTHRYNIYQQKPVIKAADLPLTINNQTITAAHLRYDAREKYITLKTYTRDDLSNLQNTLTSPATELQTATKLQTAIKLQTTQ
jgi:hypothetical protein